MKPFLENGNGNVQVVAEAGQSRTIELINRGTSPHVRVYNDSDFVAVVRFVSDPDAKISVLDGIPVLAANGEILSCGNASHVAVIMAAGSGRIWFNCGEGA